MKRPLSARRLQSHFRLDRRMVVRQSGLAGGETNAVIVRLVDSAADGHPEYRQLVDAYLAQDLPALIKEVSMVDESLPEETREKFVDAFLRQRNQRFMERLKPHLQTKSCFIAIGAAHLFGPDGMLALFDRAGYEVIPVPFKFNQP